MPVPSLPYTHTPETPADATQVMANFQAAIAPFNGGIVDDNLSAGADLNGNKLSQTPGKQVPRAAIAGQAISADKLASDAANPGTDANRAVTGDHIQLLTAAALSRFLPSAGIGKDKLKISFLDTAFGPGAMPIATVEVRPTTPIPSATNLVIGAYFLNATGGVASSYSLEVLTSTTIPTGGGYTLGTSYYTSAITATGSGSLSGFVRLVYISLT